MVHGVGLEKMHRHAQRRNRRLAVLGIIAGVAIAYGYKNYFEALLTLSDKMMPQ